LEKKDFEVEVAINGKEALKVLKGSFFSSFTFDSKINSLDVTDSAMEKI